MVVTGGRGGGVNHWLTYFRYYIKLCSKYYLKLKKILEYIFSHYKININKSSNTWTNETNHQFVTPFEINPSNQHFREILAGNLIQIPSFVFSFLRKCSLLFRSLLLSHQSSNILYQFENNERIDTKNRKKYELFLDLPRSLVS